MFRSLRIARSAPCSAMGWFLLGATVAYFLFGRTVDQSEIQSTAVTRNVFQLPFALFDRQRQLLEDETSSKNLTLVGKVEELLGKSEDVAGLLNRTVRILCLVLTRQVWHENRAKAVKETWGRRCTKLIFLSDYKNATLPSIETSIITTPNTFKWAEVRLGFRWSYDNLLNDFDWFMITEDTDYVIMENMRALLAEFNSDDPIYVGNDLTSTNGKTPIPGIALSRGALVKLVEEAMTQPNHCRLGMHEASTGLEMIRCLKYAGVQMRDTRDDIGRQRFLPLMLDNLLRPSNDLPSEKLYPFQGNEECCSNLAVMLRNIDHQEQYEYEYMLHRVHLFGRELHSATDLSTTDNDNAAYQVIYKHLETNNYLRARAMRNPKLNLPTEDKIEELERSGSTTA